MNKSQYCYHNLQYTLLLLILDKDDVDRDYFLRFTIHFATINTKLGYDLKVDGVIFTIHFATINTVIHFTQYL